jgi:uncharacterized protein
MAQVLMTPQTRGIPFGNPHFDPLYQAASRNGLPVATHLMGQTPFESHLMSLVFDGAFERHPDLRVVFIEGGFTWAMPVMSADGPDLGSPRTWETISCSGRTTRTGATTRQRMRSTGSPRPTGADHARQRGNATALYGLPAPVKALPGEGPAVGVTC